MPRIYNNLLNEAKKLYENAVEIMNKKNIVRRSDTSMMFLELLKTLFSKAGVLALNEKMAIKETSPRPYPSSSHYNTFVDALDSDVRSTFTQTSDIELATKSYTNYAEAYKLTYNNIVGTISGMVNDIGMLSMKGDSKKFHNFKDTFEKGLVVGSKAEGTIVDVPASNLTLAPSETDDVLHMDNIDKVEYDARMGSRTGMSNLGEPFYGKKYGVLDDTSDDAMRPAIKASNWKDNTIANIFDADTDAAPATFWEVEVTHRYDTIHTITKNRKKLGPRSLLGAARVNSEGLGSEGPDLARVIFFKIGAIVYQLDAKREDFFFDTNSEPAPHRMGASITAYLKAPATISRIMLTRKPVMETDVRGVTHEVNVSTIDTWDGSKWESIPQFSTDYNYIITPNTTKTNNGTESTSRNTPSGSDRAASRSRMASRGTNASSDTGDTGGTGGSGGTSDGITRTGGFNSGGTASRARSSSSTSATSSSSANTPTNTTDNKNQIPEFAKSSIWTFPTRLGVTGIRFGLYTEYPYQIRYSMTQHQSTKTSIFKKTIGWYFIQHAAGLQIKSETKNSDGSNKVLKVIDSIAKVAFAPYAIIKGVASLLSSDTKVDWTISPERTHNLDPSDSDMFRWSIELSDVSATGNKYGGGGTYTSGVYESPEPISQISIFTNHAYNGGNIEYYIKPDGMEPVKVQPMEEQAVAYDEGNVPKILYINSSELAENRKTGKWGEGAYIDTVSPMTRFQVVINITRSPLESSTPVVDGYVVKVKFADKGGDISASRATS